MLSAEVSESGRITSKSGQRLGVGERMGAVLTALHSVESLKRTELSVSWLTERCAASVVQLIQACRGLQSVEVRVQDGLLLEEGIAVLRESHWLPRCSLNVRGRRCSKQTDQCTDEASRLFSCNSYVHLRHCGNSLSTVPRRWRKSGCLVPCSGLLLRSKYLLHLCPDPAETEDEIKRYSTQWVLNGLDQMNHSVLLPRSFFCINEACFGKICSESHGQRASTCHFRSLTVSGYGACIAMAATLLVIVLLMGVGSLGSQPPSTTSQAPRQGPHFTGCLSRDLETFRCWWSAGSFRNLTEPSALRVFYRRESSPSEREECPHYSSTVPFECFFDRSHTSIWRPYCLWLLSRDEELTYDSRCFSVEDIVHPDPPMGLNWTLLNASRSGLHFDVMLHWEPPPSADVKRGWMSLLYEVQFRQRSAPRWQVLDPQQSLRRSLYGLRTDSEYEARVRCRMRAFDNFGEFSNVTLIAIPHVPSKESRVPVMVVLIFGTVGVGILLMLIIFSQQQKLMVILLPPVPAPKIKGIDPELLKKGKLDQLSIILSSQHPYGRGTPPDDPWVEHIELDFEELSERRGQPDTQRLLRPAHTPCPYDLALRDDDSGRASCCEADLPDPDATGHPRDDTPPPSPAPPPVHAQHGESGWAGKDFYTQVREVTGEGVVMLAPGPQCGAEGGEERRKKERFQLVVGGGAGGDYTTETDARRISADLSPGGGEVTLWEGEGQRSPAPPADTQPVSDYTLVQDVNEQQNLLLNPASLTLPPPSPAPCLPYPSPLVTSLLTCWPVSPPDSPRGEGNPHVWCRTCLEAYKRVFTGHWWVVHYSSTICHIKLTFAPLQDHAQSAEL
ncbi:hypothetical protein MATL_G00081300 [Megalops atlanticus]|uniref:Growth hormone receptor n=1 Tax=Megalops atlanticus TaxID=7932 RepID=A0A9D3Q765_MEGAT|nr:hypothetical protein MATL_G00081300 [Megalops atlanticus]